MSKKLIIAYFYKLNPDFDRVEACEILDVPIEYIEAVITLIRLEHVEIPWDEKYGSLGLN